MPANTFNKYLLSASTNGRQIPVTGTVAVHSATSFGTNLDEVWLYAINNGTAAIPLNIQWGGTSSYDMFQVSVPNNAGRMLIVDGKLIAGALPVMAWVTGTGTVAIDGFVNRISGVVTGLIDPVVTDWVARIVRNGGATPSLATQQALTTFIQGLTSTGIRSKMIAVCCFVPDSLTAAITPLIKSGNDPWTNVNFVSGDLTVNGLLGDGSSKYLNTGILATQFNSTSAGMTLYVTNASPTGTYDFGYTNNSGSDAAVLAFNNNATNKASFMAWNSTIGQGEVSSATAPGPGYLSGNRTSTTSINLYFANSTTTHSAIATGTGSGGSPSANTIFLGCANAYQLSGAFGYTSNRYSFAALHDGLTAADSVNLFNLVQALRVSLGGGYI